jgi:hypothetical protein
MERRVRRPFDEKGASKTCHAPVTSGLGTKELFSDTGLIIMYFILFMC